VLFGTLRPFARAFWTFWKVEAVGDARPELTRFSETLRSTSEVDDGDMIDQANVRCVGVGRLCGDVYERVALQKRSLARLRLVLSLIPASAHAAIDDVQTTSARLGTPSERFIGAKANGFGSEARARESLVSGEGGRR
jgi:hypothetical protein